MAALPWPDSKTSPVDGPASALRNSWEEFAREVQEDQSYAFEAFELQVRFFARGHIRELDWQDMALLWAVTDNAISRDAEDASLHRSEMAEAIEDELRQRTSDLAERIDISHYFDRVDPDDVEEDEAGEPEAGGQRTLF